MTLDLRPRGRKIANRGPCENSCTDLAQNLKSAPGYRAFSISTSFLQHYVQHHFVTIISKIHFMLKMKLKELLSVACGEVAFYSD